MPFINLSILNQLRAKTLAAHEEIDFAKHGKWYNKRHWLPQTFQWTKTWQQAMTRATGTEFGQYQKEMFANGILSGHVYDEAGNNYLQTWNPIENYSRMQLVPFNFTDANVLPQDLGLRHVEGAYKTLPLFWDQGKAICYHPEKEDYDKLTEVVDQKTIDEGDWDIALPICQGTSMSPAQSSSQSLSPFSEAQSSTSTYGTQQSKPSRWRQTLTSYYEHVSDISEDVIKQFTKQPDYKHFSTQVEPSKYFPTTKEYYRYYKLSPSQQTLLDLPKHTILNHIQYSLLGHEIGFKYRYLPEQSETNSYYMSSLLQLMLFCMGVDKDNQPIDEQHPLFAAHNELKKQMQAQDTNPWGLPSFKKENLLEYQIAKMMQKDPALKEKMKQTVDIFFNAWGYYNALDNLYDSPDPLTRHSLKDKKKWLLGEDLFLAYAYVMNARFLWAAATSRQAFNAVLELDPSLAMLLQLPLAPGPNQLMRNAQVKTAKGYSYLDVWQQIQGQLVVDKNIPKELASFSGHGIVMSVYHDLTEQQKQNGVQNPSIMNRLGFSVIDSYYGEQLSPMYRNKEGKESEATCDIQQLTTGSSQTKRSTIKPT
jgi:hypothetical protein